METLMRPAAEGRASTAANPPVFTPRPRENFKMHPGRRTVVKKNSLEGTERLVSEHEKGLSGDLKSKPEPHETGIVVRDVG